MLAIDVPKDYWIFLSIFFLWKCESKAQQIMGTVN